MKRIDPCSTVSQDTLREKIEVILWNCHNQSDGGGCNGNNKEGDWYGMDGCDCGLKENIDELLALINKERQAAAEQFMDQVMNLDAHIVADIEKDHFEDGARLFSRLCTVFCDMFGPPMLLTESNLGPFPTP